MTTIRQDNYNNTHKTTKQQFDVKKYFSFQKIFKLWSHMKGNSVNDWNFRVVILWRRPLWLICPDTGTPSCTSGLGISGCKSADSATAVPFFSLQVKTSNRDSNSCFVTNSKLYWQRFCVSVQVQSPTVCSIHVTLIRIWTREECECYGYFRGLSYLNSGFQLKL